MIPGEYLLATDDIVVNAGRATVQMRVVNTGDRPIQVGSHYHFFEVNCALAFDRARVFGMRLNIPAGTAVRFEPGDDKLVTLVRFGGAGIAHGFNNLVNGSTSKGDRAAAVRLAQQRGFRMNEP